MTVLVVSPRAETVILDDHVYTWTEPGQAIPVCAEHATLLLASPNYSRPRGA